MNKPSPAMIGYAQQARQPHHTTHSFVHWMMRQEPREPENSFGRYEERKRAIKEPHPPKKDPFRRDSKSHQPREKKKMDQWHGCWPFFFYFGCGVLLSSCLSLPPPALPAPTQQTSFSYFLHTHTTGGLALLLVLSQLP